MTLDRFENIVISHNGRLFSNLDESFPIFAGAGVYCRMNHFATQALFAGPILNNLPEPGAALDEAVLAKDIAFRQPADLTFANGCS